MNSTDFIKNINTNQKNDKYGNINKTPTQLYKNYVDYITKKTPNAKLMSFAEWIKWAKDKGLVPQKEEVAADGELTEKKEKIIELKKSIKKNNIGILIGSIILIGCIASLAYNYNKST